MPGSGDAATSGLQKVREAMGERPITFALVVAALPFIGLGTAYVASERASAASATKIEVAVISLAEAVKAAQADAARERDRRDAANASIVANATATTQAVITMQTQIAVLQRDQDRERELNERRQQATSNSLMQLRDLTARALQGNGVRPNSDPTGMDVPAVTTQQQARRTP